MSDDQTTPQFAPDQLFAEEEMNFVKRYLLGESSAEERQRIEINLLRDQRFADNLLLVENELIDDYASGALSQREQELFLRNFLTTPRRQQKLAAIRALIDYANQAVAPETESPKLEPVRDSFVLSWWRALLVPSWKVAVYAVVLLGLGLGAWRWLRLPAASQQALASLNQAYRQQRPLAARISRFTYAPFVVTRGPNDDPRTDERALDEAEVLIRQAVRESPNAESLRMLGRLSLAKKEFGKAITALEQALTLAPNDAQLHNDLGAALLEQSQLTKQNGDQSQGALQLGRSLDELNKAVELDATLLEAIFNRALCRQTMGLMNQAEAGWNEYLQKDSTSPWAVEARQRLQEMKEQKQKVLRLKEHAFDDFVAAYESHNEEQAWQAFKIARTRSGNAITDQLIDEWLSSQQSGQTANATRHLQLMEFAGTLAQTRTGDLFTFALARYYRTQATPHASSLTQARQTLQAAMTTYNQAQMQAAFDLFTKAARMFRACDDECEALFAESWSAYCQTRLGNTDVSLPLLKRLAATYQTKAFKSQLAYALESMADSYSSQDELSLALAKDAEAASIAEEAEDLSNKLRSQSGLMSLNRMVGRYDAALSSSFDTSLVANQIALEARQCWPIYNSVSFCLIKLGFLQAALDTQQEALQIADQAAWPLYQSRAAIQKGMILSGLKKNSEALACASQSIEAVKKIADEELRNSTLADVLFFQGHLLRQQRNQPEAIASYEKALTIYAGQSFQFFSLKAREGSFLSRLLSHDEAGAASDLAQIIEIQNKFRRQIQEDSSRNAFFADEQEFTDAAIQYKLQKQNEPTEAFQLAENSRARTLLDLQKTEAKVIYRVGETDLQVPSLANPMTLAEIQKRMPARAQIIQIAVLSDKIISWVIRQNSFYVAQRDVQPVMLAQKIDRFVQHLATPETASADAIKPLAQELHSLLIAPLEQYLTPQELLCLIPDKSLHALPFSALIASHSGHYLLEDYPVITAPSATAFVLCSEAAQFRTKYGENLLSMGDPALPIGLRDAFPALPSARLEAEQIAVMYSAKNNAATLLTNERAKESAFKKLAPIANVIHIAGHAVADSRAPLLSKLLLAPDSLTTPCIEDTDGALHAFELYQLRLPLTKLVILSACRTGTGRTYSGEGVIHLARPFLAVGVPTIVVSLWNIDSAQTKDLMLRFHENRKLKKQTVTEALRNAQLETLRHISSAPRQTYDWAAFYVVGGITI